MSISILDYLYQVVLPSGATIAELTDATPAAAVNVLSAMAAGDVLPQFVGGHGAAPAIDFRSPQIKTILDACGLFGYDASAGNCDLHYRSGTNFSTRAATGLRIRCVKALMYWSQITARQGGLADIACRIIPTFDGTNAPMSSAGATAAPALSLPAQYYTLGPVSINGTAVAGVTDWSLDLGVKLHTEAGDGEAYPSWCGVEAQAPVLTLNTRTLSQFATVSVGGLALNGTTGLVFYLRNKTADLAGNVANGTSTHIKFSAANGAVFMENASGGGDGPAACALKIYLRRSDTSAAHPLTISTASAIT